MVISKKMTVLIAAILVLAAGLFSTVGGTYAHNVIYSKGQASLNIQMEKYTKNESGTAAWTPITNDSPDTLFPGTIWEPGAMRAVTIKVSNLPATNTVNETETASPSFRHWFYPYAVRATSDTSSATAAPAATATPVPAYLAEVMDVYLYVHQNSQDSIPMDGKRPDLSKFTYLGKLSTLKAKEIPTINNTNKELAPIKLNAGDSQIYTLLLKMDEAAGNEYQNAVANVYAVVYAEQTSS